MSSVSRTPVIKTLRARLTLLHLGTLAVTLGLFAALSYQVLSRTLHRHHDDELAHQAEDLVQALGDGPLTTSAIDMAVDRSSVGSRFVMVRDDRGGLLFRDSILQTTEPTVGQHTALVHAASTGSKTPEFFTVSLERSGEVRFICVPLRNATAYVQIGDPLGDVRETLRSIAWSCLPLIPIVLLLSSSGGWLIARRALAPMRSMTSTLKEIHATDLSRRVDVRTTDEEVGSLVATLNHLLDRLQRAFDALRQFAGDVSHQIQTPLTVMKASIDIALRAPQPVGSDTLLRQLSDEVSAVSVTVAELQAFALADEPLDAAATIDLSQVLEEAADIVSALGELKGVVVEAQLGPAVLVRGDAVRLKQVVLNLGDNAVKYTPEGGHVWIRLRVESHQAFIEVQDTGIGIAPEDVPRIFDRLFRVDAADRSTHGAGLGLAIAKRIVEVHRGTIEVMSQPGRGTTFTVAVPRAVNDLGDR